MPLHHRWTMTISSNCLLFAKHFSCQDQLWNIEFLDKELFAIVNSFKKWCHLLEGSSHQLMVYTNYNFFEYFMSSCVLNWRQACLSISLSCFNFIITYWSKHHRGLSNALSRQSYLVPKQGIKAYIQQCTIVFKPEHIHLHPIGIEPSFFDQVCKTHHSRTLLLDIKEQLDNQSSQ